MTMNFLDRAIHQVAPGWSEKRQAARARVDVLQQLDKLLPSAGASASMGGGEGGAYGNPSAAGGRWWRTTPRDARFDTHGQVVFHSLGQTGAPFGQGAAREMDDVPQADDLAMKGVVAGLVPEDADICLV